uniref:Uncharacterized protein n=1 Tax=Arundo donax TaxID=35708 RepID=A0A0A9GKT8_ARUDO
MSLDQHMDLSSTGRRKGLIWGNLHQSNITYLSLSLSLLFFLSLVMITYQPFLVSIKCSPLQLLYNLNINIEFLKSTDDVSEITTLKGTAQCQLLIFFSSMTSQCVT